MRLLVMAAAAILAPAAAAAAKGPKSLQRPEAFEALVRCRALTDDAARLRCFDSAAATLQQQAENRDLVVVDRKQIQETKRSLFGLDIPDLNPFLRATRSRLRVTTPWHYLRFRTTRTRAVIIFYSVAARAQGRGLNAAMLHRVTTALKAAGYTHLGITWIADVNQASLRQVQKMGARPLHRLHLFRKALA